MLRNPRPPSSLTQLPAWLFPACLLIPQVSGNPLDSIPQFVAVQDRAGLSFIHDHGGSGHYYVWESVGPGITVLDYDADGRLDVYAPQGSRLPGAPVRDRPLINRLFRNLGGRFESPVDSAVYRRRPLSVAGDDGYGMGAAASDYDRDGHIDLYLTNWGANVLLRNNGDGTFHDVTGPSGADDPRWSTAALWADLDADGDPDLYVTNYLDASLDNHRSCHYGTAGIESYCGPVLFDGVADELFRNESDGTFTATGTSAGIANATEGKGMAVDAVDDDDDGDLDIYVANDTRSNFLYRNDGAGRFHDEGLPTGSSLSGDGRPQAGMGIVWDDLDGDEDADLVVTNFQDDYNTFYRRQESLYVDDSAAASLRGPSLPFVGFGIVGFDPDLDGDLDLYVANGHIYQVREHYDSRLAYAQRDLMFLNRGDGVFREVSRDAGPGFAHVAVSRGAAAADLDDDGDPDLLVANNGGSLVLLANGSWAQSPDQVGAGRSVRVRLVGRTAARDGLGATVTCIVAGRRLVRRMHPGGSFMSQNGPELLCGLGGAPNADIEVRWWGEQRDVVESVEAGERVVITEGRGITARSHGSRGRRAPPTVGPAARVRPPDAGQ